MNAYIIINKNYTATVHTAKDLTEFLTDNPKEVDLSCFGFKKDHEDRRENSLISIVVTRWRERLSMKTGYAIKDDQGRARVRTFKDNKDDAKYEQIDIAIENGEIIDDAKLGAHYVRDMWKKLYNKGYRCTKHVLNIVEYNDWKIPELREIS